MKRDQKAAKETDSGKDEKTAQTEQKAQPKQKPNFHRVRLARRQTTRRKMLFWGKCSK